MHWFLCNDCQVVHTWIRVTPVFPTPCKTRGPLIRYAWETLIDTFIQVDISFYVFEVTFAEGGLQKQIRELSMAYNRGNQYLKAVARGEVSSGLIGLSYLGKQFFWLHQLEGVLFWGFGRLGILLNGIWWPPLFRYNIAQCFYLISMFLDALCIRIHGFSQNLKLLNNLFLLSPEPMVLYGARAF